MVETKDARELFGAATMRVGRLLGPVEHRRVSGALLYRLARRLDHAPYGDTLARTTMAGGYIALLPASEPSLRHTALSGRYEPETEDFIDRVLGPGDVALDVGANIGLHTLRMARAVGDAGHVFSFEPAPRAREILAAAVAENGWVGRVTIEDVALNDTGGDLRLYVDQSGAGLMSSLIASPALTDGLTVRGATLDDLVPGLQRRPRLIKIDVEGAELAVLNGGGAFFADQRPDHLVVEIGSGRDNSALIDRIAALGYDRLGSNSLDEQAGDWYRNVFFRAR